MVNAFEFPSATLKEKKSISTPKNGAIKAVNALDDKYEISPTINNISALTCII